MACYRQQSMNSRDLADQGVCSCSPGTCQCTCQGGPISTDQILDDFEMIKDVDTDDGETYRADSEPVQSIGHHLTPGFQALEACARQWHIMLSYPAHIQDEIPWLEGFLYRIEQPSYPPSMEASMLLNTTVDTHDNNNEDDLIEMSMIVEVSNKSLPSSMSSSMILGIGSSSSHMLSRNPSFFGLDGIGSRWEDNYFTHQPLKLGAEAEYCLSFQGPTRSLSLPVLGNQNDEHQG